MERQYETVFIVTPVLSDDQVKETVDKYESFLKDRGAKIINREEWGMRKLAYPIQKKKTGFYNLFEYTAEEGSTVGELELAFRRDERIMRYLTVKLDKHAIAYSERRRKKLAEKKQEETKNE